MEVSNHLHSRQQSLKPATPHRQRHVFSSQEPRVFFGLRLRKLHRCSRVRISCFQLCLNALDSRKSCLQTARAHEEEDMLRQAAPGVWAEDCRCVSIYIYICIYNTYQMFTYIYKNRSVYDCFFTCIYIHACKHTYRHTCMHTYIHTCMHACMHTYIHTYIHNFSTQIT